MRDALVLGYHAVSADWPASLAVRPDVLDEHLTLLVRRGYRGGRLSDIVAGLGPERALAVTFDDAYVSTLERAAPILARHGLPGTVYVPTDWPGRPGPMRWPGIDRWEAEGYGGELRCLSWDQLRELDAMGWEIGAHTCSHPHLTRVDDAQLQRELIDSKALVEDEIGKRCRSLAYPYGDADARVARAAGAAGFENAVTLPRAREPLLTREVLLTPRIPVHRVDDLARLRLKVAPSARRVRASKLFHRFARAAAPAP